MMMEKLEQDGLDGSDGIYLDGDSDGRYIDWSGVLFEVGDGQGGTVQFPVSTDDLRRLHAALTAHLFGCAWS